VESTIFQIVTNQKRMPSSSYLRSLRLPLILGSSSSSRRAVLSALEVSFTVISPDIDEKAVRAETPELLTKAVANAKMDALIPKCVESYPNGCYVIASDQVVVGPEDSAKAREKPETEEQAREFVKSYSGASCSTVSHIVVALLTPSSGTDHLPIRISRREGSDRSTVYFKKFAEEDVSAILKPGAAIPLSSLLPLAKFSQLDSFKYGSSPSHGRCETDGTASASIYGCAGGLCIEHNAYARNITSISGSLDSVHGLPVDLLCSLMKDLA